MKNGELCVPANALAEAGEAGGAGIAPEVGDSVEMTLTGRVTRTEGGELYIQPETVNGQALENKGMGDDAGGENYDMAGEEEALRAMPAGAASLLGVLALLFVMVFGAGAADLEWARARTCTGGSVSNNVTVINNANGRTNGLQVFNVEINQFSGGTLYLMVFDSNTNQLAGATPHFTAVPVPTGSVGQKEFAGYGAPFLYGVNVCLSTTPFSLTNASSGGTATVIWSPIK